VSVDHYENFPVASILCPPALRPAIVAIYHFARTADDIADEGLATPQARRAALDAYREELRACLCGQPATAAPHARVFVPLADAVARHGLPAEPLHDLLDAFTRDAGNPVYANRDELLGYCSRSANPIGRLLLHLYGVRDAASVRQSDAVCSALQLANFWQDLSVDLPRGRLYVPLADAARHGLSAQALLQAQDTPALRRLVLELVAWARTLMLQGAGLATTLPGRAGWELRLVVQGGLRILERVERMGGASVAARPTLGAADAPLLLWRALRMRSTKGAAAA
jgi:squalene synthase HpnC